MRFISLCTILGAALLPVATAAPCRPSKPTSILSATTTAETETETLSTATATATATDFYSTVTAEATSSLETSLTETATWSETTTFVSDYTTEYTATTDATSTEDVTTTISEAPGPTNLIQNGDFEEDADADWSLRTGDIKNNHDRANSGDKYVQFEIVNNSGVGGNNLNQTINGLETDRLYRISYSAAVFDDPELVLGASSCTIDIVEDYQVISSQAPNYAALGEYKEFYHEFTPVKEDVTITLRLRCTGSDRVTLAVGVDDVSLYDVGVAPK